jgi:site-specific DNA recombinase
VIVEERARLQAEQTSQAPQLDVGAALIRSAIDLLEDPQELYRQTTDLVRRQLNQVFFDKLYLDPEGVTDDILSEPFAGLAYRRSFHHPPTVHLRRRAQGARQGGPGTIRTSAALLERIALVDGSSKAAMVELRGLEPLTPSLRTTCATSCATAPDTAAAAATIDHQG